jgi:hypothetical protein
LLNSTIFYHNPIQKKIHDKKIRKVFFAELSGQKILSARLGRAENLNPKL